MVIYDTLRYMKTTEIAPGVVVDYDKDNKVVGIEITDGSKYADTSALAVHGIPVPISLTTKD